jgi:hypothetical protein
MKDKNNTVSVQATPYNIVQTQLCNLLLPKHKNPENDKATQTIPIIFLNEIFRAPAAFNKENKEKQTVVVVVVVL